MTLNDKRTQAGHQGETRSDRREREAAERQARDAERQERQQEEEQAKAWVEEFEQEMTACRRPGFYGRI